MTKKKKIEDSETVKLSDNEKLGLIGGGDMDALDYRDEPDTRPIAMQVNMPIEPEITREVDSFRESAVGFINSSHRFFWEGKDIMDRVHVGSGDNASQCNVDAGLQGSSTCHIRRNPDFIEPEIVEPTKELPPTPRELNAFYKAGHEDGFRYFEDLKALILAWATDQALSGGVPDVDALPFVVYARHNP